MDVLRSCYSTLIKPYAETDDQVWIDWYFCSRKGLPFATIFCSANWDTDHLGGDEPGEVWLAPRPWRDGSGVGDAAGGTPCGSAADFAGQLPAPPPEPVPLDAFGTPLCCQRVTCTGKRWCPAARACLPNSFTRGAVALGPLIDCYPLANLLGAGPIVMTSSCTGEGAGTIFCALPPPGRNVPVELVLTIGGAGRVTLVANIAAGQIAQWRASGWDYASPVTLTAFGTATEILWQPTVLLTPI